MCGIVGFFTNFGLSKDQLRSKICAMNDTLVHRGPDDSGIWVDMALSIALGHRRLAIQDLSPTGQQPMMSSSGRFHIVFNGEIYNFKEIQHDLIGRGYQFRGSSDTEVLLASVEEWGIELALKKSRGMFAIAIWDQKERELILARDRMGEKPLFYGWIEGAFVFASELKAIRKIFSISMEIDPAATAAFFRFGYVPSPHCIYKNFFKLVPGTYLRISLSQLSTLSDFNPLSDNGFFCPQAYWTLQKSVNDGLLNPILDEQEAITQFDSLLQNTLSLHQISDVPLGAFLSGGIDSSLICAVLQAISKSPVKTFTIGFKEKEFDEAPYARSIANYLGTDHHEYYVSASDGLDLIPEISKYWDEPFADVSQIPSLMVARIARQDVTVCLTGDGGDELFCGYNRYFANAALWSMINKIPLQLRRLAGKSLSLFPPRVWQNVYDLSKKLVGSYRTQANVGLKVQKLAKIMQMRSEKDAYLYLMSVWDNPKQLLMHTQESSSVFDRQPTPGLGHFIHDAMCWDQLGYLVDDNLVKGDRSSMAASLETRLPLLDHRIVEFSWRLPLAMKYRRGQSKWLLRQVLYKYVPKELIERPKMGFSVPISDWLRGELRDWAGDLMHSYCCNEKLENKSVLQKIWREHMLGINDHGNKLWILLTWINWKFSVNNN